MMLATERAFTAGGGLSNVKTIVDTISENLNLVAIGIVSIAFMIAGYKVLFGGYIIQKFIPIRLPF